MEKWLKRITEMGEKYGTTFKTMQDVRNFQIKHGLVVDGKIGPETEKKNTGTVRKESSKGFRE